MWSFLSVNSLLLLLKIKKTAILYPNCYWTERARGSCLLIFVILSLMFHWNIIGLDEYICLPIVSNYSAQQLTLERLVQPKNEILPKPVWLTSVEHDRRRLADAPSCSLPNNESGWGPGALKRKRKITIKVVHKSLLKPYNIFIKETDLKSLFTENLAWTPWSPLSSLYAKEGLGHSAKHLLCFEKEKVKRVLKDTVAGDYSF